jgi:hypothetical protein
MKDMKAERPLMPRRHRQRQANLEREVDDDEASDLEPLHVKMPNEEMQKAQPEPEAEVAAEVEDQIPDFHSSFEGQPNLEVFTRGPSDKSVLTEYGVTLKDVNTKIL